MHRYDVLPWTGREGAVEQIRAHVRSVSDAAAATVVFAIQRTTALLLAESLAEKLREPVGVVVGKKGEESKVAKRLLAAGTDSAAAGARANDDDGGEDDDDDGGGDAAICTNGRFVCIVSPSDAPRGRPWACRVELSELMRKWHSGAVRALAATSTQ